MTLIKKFLHKEPGFLPESRLVLRIGILAGLLYSFIFYSFLYLVRETVRILSVTESCDLWVLGDTEVHFYNLIFAFISVITGQSVTFSIWCGKPGKLFENRYYRRVSILHDHRTLNWIVLSWFSKLALIFGVFFGIDGGFYTFSLFPDHSYIFILIVIVLFMSGWATTILTYKRKGLKWMVISATLISLLSFGFSRINLIDYNAINQNYLQHNIHHNYRLELPESDYYEHLYQLSRIEDLYIVETKTHENNRQPVIIVDNNIIPIEKLNIKLADWWSGRDAQERIQLICRLHIHKSIKMNIVNQVRNELAKCNISRIAYAVVPINHEYDQRYYQNYSFNVRLPNSHNESIHPEKANSDEDLKQNAIAIRMTESGCLINDSLVHLSQVQNTLKYLIHLNPDYIIKLQVSNEVVFSHYLTVLSGARSAVAEIRKEYSEKYYLKQYDMLTIDERIETDQEIPFRIVEINR